MIKFIFYKKNPLLDGKPLQRGIENIEIEASLPLFTL